MDDCAALGTWGERHGELSEGLPRPVPHLAVPAPAEINGRLALSIVALTAPDDVDVFSGCSQSQHKAPNI